jgi:hypothetical protein
MEEPLQTHRRTSFAEPTLTMEGVDKALRARVAASREETARQVATDAVDAGRVPGVVIVPGETMGPQSARTPGQIAVQAALQVRY